MEEGECKPGRNTVPAFYLLRYMTISREEVVNDTERALARSPFLWLAIAAALGLFVFFGWLFLLAFTA
jgi:hypothetical protein